jgi:hypothetical protein
VCQCSGVRPVVGLRLTDVLDVNRRTESPGETVLLVAICHHTTVASLRIGHCGLSQATSRKPTAQSNASSATALVPNMSLDKERRG